MPVDSTRDKADEIDDSSSSGSSQQSGEHQEDCHFSESDSDENEDVNLNHVINMLDKSQTKAISLSSSNDADSMLSDDRTESRQSTTEQAETPYLEVEVIRDEATKISLGSFKLDSKGDMYTLYKIRMINMLKKKELWKGARKTAENIRDAVDKEIKLQYDKLTGANRSKSTKRKAKKRPLEIIKQPKPAQPKPVQVTSTAVKTQRQSQTVKTS